MFHILSKHKVICILSLSLIYFFNTNIILGEILTTSNPFASLQQKLIEDGFNKEYINKIYSKPFINFDQQGVSSFFVHRESTINYDQFTSASSIRQARKYIKNYNKELKFAEKEFGVDQTIITAIILVETRLGKVLGNRSIINTFSTMASLFNSDLKEIIWESIPDKKRISRKKFEKKAEKKAKWAYEELKAFLQYIEREKLDPEKICGSYAGAMGIAQFMPSNALKLAKDGDKDGHINLFNHADAIASIGYYLKYHGWDPDINHKKAYKVLFKYNRSSYYVETLLKISDLLKIK